VTYAVTVQTSRVADEARFYQRRHHCRFKGPHITIRDATVYRTTTKTPQPPAEANTIIEEVITTSKTVLVGSSETSSGEVRTARQEIGPPYKVVQMPSPPVPTGTGSGAVCYIAVDVGPGFTPPVTPTNEGEPVAKDTGGSGVSQTQHCEGQG